MRRRIIMSIDGPMVANSKTPAPMRKPMRLRVYPRRFESARSARLDAIAAATAAIPSTVATAQYCTVHTAATASMTLAMEGVRNESVTT